MGQRRFETKGGLGSSDNVWRFATCCLHVLLVQFGDTAAEPHTLYRSSSPAPPSVVLALQALQNPALLLVLLLVITCAEPQL